MASLRRYMWIVTQIFDSHFFNTRNDSLLLALSKWVFLASNLKVSKCLRIECVPEYVLNTRGLSLAERSKLGIWSREHIRSSPPTQAVQIKMLMGVSRGYCRVLVTRFFLLSRFWKELCCFERKTFVSLSAGFDLQRSKSRTKESTFGCKNLDDAQWIMSKFSMLLNQ